MSQQNMNDYTPPENLIYPEFTTKKESDKIIELLTSGILRTHADTFNALDINYLNNLPGPSVTTSKKFKTLFENFLIETNLLETDTIPVETIRNWEPEGTRLFLKELNSFKMFLLDDFLPKINTIKIPKLNTKIPKKYCECKLTKKFYFCGIQKLEITFTFDIDAETFLMLVEDTDKDLVVEKYKTSPEFIADPTLFSNLEVKSFKKHPDHLNDPTITIKNYKLQELLQNSINIEKILFLYQKFIFSSTEKEINYLKEYSEPKLLEELINIESIHQNYPKVTEETLKELFSLFKSLKIFWLFDTEILKKDSKVSKDKIQEDLVIVDNIQIKPKIKEI